MKLLVTIHAKPKRLVSTYTGPLNFPRQNYEGEPGVEWSLEDLKVPRLPPEYGATAPIPTEPNDLLALGSKALRDLAEQLNKYASAAEAVESGKAVPRNGSPLALFLERLERESPVHSAEDCTLSPELLEALARDE